MIRKESKKFEQLKMKALEPQERFCTLIEKKVCVLIEYQDYKSSRYKGDQGTIYCENIIDCYHKKRRCRYSGISPSYPDPLISVKLAEQMFKSGELQEEKKFSDGYSYLS